MKPASRSLTAVVLVVLVFLTSSCAFHHPPDWGWFDVDRRPVGAYPANTGFYAGEILYYPLSWIVACVGLLTGNPPPPTLVFDSRGAAGLGLVTGLVLGAPFHLLGLPFGESGGDGDDGGAGEVRYRDDRSRDSAPTESLEGMRPAGDPWK